MNTLNLVSVFRAALDKGLMYLRIIWNFCKTTYSNSVGMEWCLRFCISKKFPGDAETTALWTTR